MRRMIRHMRTKRMIMTMAAGITMIWLFLVMRQAMVVDRVMSRMTLALVMIISFGEGHSMLWQGSVVTKAVMRVPIVVMKAERVGFIFDPC
ncbi:MAG: hypothetical protein D6746_10815 [Bacteroidetes bacterium]|nr:MAG: hypothetical protein D6746_10815 [Bacteroidota bacterium]